MKNSSIHSAGVVRRSVNFLKGFTLVELLVAVAIISILTAIVTANFSTARARARDAKRISDVAQIQLALAYFFDRCNQYPKIITDLDYECPVNSDVTLGQFLSKIPSTVTIPNSNPSSNADNFKYLVNDTRVPLSYNIVVSLETNGSAISDSFTEMNGYLCRDHLLVGDNNQPCSTLGGGQYNGDACGLNPDVPPDTYIYCVGP